MEAEINQSAIGIVLVSMAVASLFAMVGLTRINYIVHGDLYNYGLRFSYRWAMPYWVLSGIIFGLSWLNILLSIIVTLYIFKKSRKQSLVSRGIAQAEIEEITQFEEHEEQRKLTQYAESQEETSIALKQEDAEESQKKFVEEQIVQPNETLDRAEEQESQVDRQKTDEEEAGSAEETHAQTEAAGQPQSIPLEQNSIEKADK